MTFDAIVIGAGANGLVAAAALAKAGRRVLLAERAETVGGTLRAIEFAPGFRAAPLARDHGWLPSSLTRGLGLAGTAPRSAPVPFSVQADERDWLSLPTDMGRAGEAIARYSKPDAARWPEFIAQLHRQAGFLARLYLRPVPDLKGAGARELLSLAQLALAFRRLGRADMNALLRTLPMSVQDLGDDWFACEPLKAALAAGGVQHIRQGPRAGGTAFVLLHHLVGAPVGAIRRAGHWPGAGLAATLEACARRHGVTIRAGAEVRRITVKDDAVTGVVLDDGVEIAAPLVLSSADPARTLLGLVDPVWLDPEFLHAAANIKLRGCTAFVLYALDAPFEAPGLDGGSLTGVLSLTATCEALERAHDAAKYGRISERPHVELTVPTLAAPRDAPEGKHVLVARVQYTPYAPRDGDWTTDGRDALAETVTGLIEKAAPGFAARIRHRAVLAPPDLEARFALTEGAPTHGELTLDQILVMRPVPGWSRYAMPIDGLYLCGAGAHPGPGIVGGAGWHAASQALRTHSSSGGPAIAG